MRVRRRFMGAFITGAALMSGALTQVASSSTLMADSAQDARVIQAPAAHFDFSAALSQLHRAAPRVPGPSKVLTKAPKKTVKKVAKRATAKARAKTAVKVAPIAPRVVTPAVPPVGSSAYRDLILSMVHFSWRALDFSITFKGPRSGYLGLTSVGLKSSPHNHVDVYVRSGEPIDEVAYIAAYEIGHVVDVSRNTDSDRKAWLTQRGNPRASWFTCNACAENMVGAGDFSDVFAWATTNHGYFVSEVAGPPTAAQLSRLTPYFAR